MRPAHSLTTRGRPRWPVLALLLAGMAGALAVLPGCSRTQGAATTQLTVAGSTSITPFAEQLAEEFMHARAGAHVNIQGIGSSAGIQATETGAADVGMSSRELKEAEVRELAPVTMALDAMAIIVHPSNPVRNLSILQLRSMFAGDIKNWREVGGRDAAVTLVNREAGSGARGAFEELVMGKHGRPLSYRALRQGSQGAVQAVVEGDPNAIGYISSGVISPGARALRIEGVEPTPREATAGRYKLVRPFLLVLRRGATPAQPAKEFIAYVLSDEGQGSLVHAGLIAAPRREVPWKD